MKAEAGPLDGIVVLELALGGHGDHEVQDVIACLRAGAMAWEAAPFTVGVEQVMRARRVSHVLDVARELEVEALRVHEAREAEYRRQAKEAERGARAVLRAKQ